ncbi:PTS fructose transporter subunit IIABC [Salsuginibacillus kocurii]|uniref:PTS fructose transporter subunit IIABC n=1 Tax=Salsuginibacillus kocurii TaxID=427078 RepID=UPI0003643C5D|nr:fructose-specific PTS transporter subunit EIIC [Salsuginibacillus kocurii]
MRITELLTENTMILDLKSKDKPEVIAELTGQLEQAGHLKDAAKFQEAIQAREDQSTTGMGEGIAIPHAKTAAVDTPAIAFGRSEQGVEYDSLDGEPAHLFFMIAATEGANQDHLQTLSRLSTLLMDQDFREQLLQAEDKRTILELVDRKEKEKLDQEETKADAAPEEKETTGRKVLAVTGCPTGIAHTYMAADALKQKAAEMNVDIKVQTNGSDGVKNRLTATDIEEAEAIIVASDTKVDMGPFHGKPVLQKGVTDGMKRPEELIQAALDGEAPIYEGGGENADTSSASGSGGGVGGFYKHLMNGVSNMLPFVVGGGILLAISFMIDIDLDNPLAAALDSIGGDHAFGLMVAVLAGFIAMSIADRPGFAPGMIGGFMAHTGDAGFLGGLIVGFLAGYVVLGFKRVFSGLPKTFDGIKTILIYPVLSIAIVGLLMEFVIITPVAEFMAFLETWLGNMTGVNAAILGLILGGMMAIDMGGPINKTAFAFGLAMIDAGNFGPHAAVMAGGMVPPLGIALATTFFRNKFNEEERDAGKTNYILGASFITEGAIPFAAADPGRVIPSLVIGSTIAGGMSMFFNIGLEAAHGGLFVSFAVEGGWMEWGLYMIAIITGAIVTALMLGLWKKPLAK